MSLFGVQQQTFLTDFLNFQLKEKQTMHSTEMAKYIFALIHIEEMELQV